MHCPICLDVLDAAVESVCGHAYCAECTVRYLERDTGRAPLCPTCRAPMENLHPSFSLRQLIPQLVARSAGGAGGVRRRFVSDSKARQLDRRLENLSAHHAQLQRARARLASDREPPRSRWRGGISKHAGTLGLVLLTLGALALIVYMAIPGGKRRRAHDVPRWGEAAPGTERLDEHELDPEGYVASAIRARVRARSMAARAEAAGREPPPSSVEDALLNGPGGVGAPRPAQDRTKQLTREEARSSAELFAAAVRGDVRRVAAYLQPDKSRPAAYVDYVDPATRLRPLHVAAKGGHLIAVIALCDHGADVEAPSGEGATAIYYAAEAGHFDVVRVLAEDCGARVDARYGRSGASPLVIAVENRHEALVRLLLDMGADPDIAGAGGYAALHIAAGAGLAELIKALLAANATADLPSAVGETPVFVAARAGEAAAARVLLDASPGAVHVATREGATPLYVAAEYGRLSTVRLLLSRGAEVDRQFVSGATALLIAAQKGYREILGVLLDAGANPDAWGEGRQSALQLAVIGGHLDAARALLDAGADFDFQLSF
eukprot:tig00000042_g15577.t1